MKKKYYVMLHILKYHKKILCLCCAYKNEAIHYGPSKPGQAPSPSKNSPCMGLQVQAPTHDLYFFNIIS